MTAGTAHQTPIKYFLLSDCSLLVTPPVRGKSLEKSVTNALLEGFRSGDDINAILSSILNDTSAGSVYQQVATQIEDSKRAQRANAVQEVEQKFAGKIEDMEQRYHQQALMIFEDLIMSVALSA